MAPVSLVEGSGYRNGSDCLVAWEYKDVNLNKVIDELILTSGVLGESCSQEGKYFISSHGGLFLGLI